MDENLIDLEILTVKDQAYRIKDGALTERVEKLEQNAGAGGSGGGGTQGPQGEKGDKGDKGDPGNDGADGKSAYEIWLDAGNQGTETDFLNAIKGAKGDKGDKGDSGAPGTNGADGVNGNDGANGADGKSAYQIWLDAGNQGTETDFLNALKGAKGDKGDKGDPGNDGAPGTNGTNGNDGTNGADGKSAYEIWLDAGNQGTQSDFLNSLKGAKGDKGDKGDPGNDGTNGTNGTNGADGKSAYDLWLDAGNQGTETDFLNSIKGAKGDKGEKGDPFSYDDFTEEQYDGIANIVASLLQNKLHGWLKQIPNLDAYTDKAEVGEVVQYIGTTNDKYRKGWNYEKTIEGDSNSKTLSAGEHYVIIKSIQNDFSGKESYIDVPFFCTSEIMERGYSAPSVRLNGVDYAFNMSFTTDMDNVVGHVVYVSSKGVETREIVESEYTQDGIVYIALSNGMTLAKRCFSRMGYSDYGVMMYESLNGLRVGLYGRLGSEPTSNNSQLLYFPTEREKSSSCIEVNVVGSEQTFSQGTYIWKPVLGPNVW